MDLAADEPDDRDPEERGDEAGDSELVGRQRQRHGKRTAHPLGKEGVKGALERQHEAERKESVLHAEAISRARECPCRSRR